MDKNNLLKICIIGCGTYGSYLIKRLVETHTAQTQISVIEIGDEKIKSEKEIGIVSESQLSKAAEQGRYFGLGGTSARWGGQILFFDERDNPLNHPDWQYIIDTNNKYRRTVIQNLLGKDCDINTLLNCNADIKTGVWLKYSKRNTFNLLNRKNLEKVKIFKNQRVTDFVFNGNTIKSVVTQNAGGEKQMHEADIFYLTAGAIESCRLLLNINEGLKITLSKDLGCNFGDQLSVELFKILSYPPVFEGTDHLPIFHNGSLITKRIVVFDGANRVGFIHFSFNNDIRIFSLIKQLFFGKQKIKFDLNDLFGGLGFLIRFGFSILVLKKMYAHGNNWNVHLDIEQEFPNKNSLQLSEVFDKYGQKGVKLEWSVSGNDITAIEKIKQDLSKRLEKADIPFKDVYNAKIDILKIEDVYHPVGFMRIGQDKDSVLDYDCRVRGIGNLFHFSTAMFPSAKSINPTGAAFCFIEKHLKTFFI
jgi:hypothetical protein